MSKTYDTVLLAALLHDIGKLYQKGTTGEGVIDNRGKHPEVSYHFIEYFTKLFEPYVDIELLKELVKRHHENERAFDKEYLAQYAVDDVKPLAYIISTADNFSSSERDVPGDTPLKYKTTALASAFSGIRIGEHTSETLFHRFSPLSASDAFPVPGLKQTVESANAQHIDEFTKEIKIMELQKPADFNSLFTVLETLLQKYTWCCPSSTYDAVPDVSLYDHLRTTAAIAAALWRYHSDSGDMSINSIKDDNKKKFKLVAGDFSGIQNYIFSSAQTGAKGMAKRLRARSFYIGTFLNVIAMHILEVFEMPQCAALISSGGKFYLVLPNTKDSDALIEGLSARINSFLFSEFQGDVCVNLCHVDLSGKELMNFSNAVKNLNISLSLKKNEPFKQVLMDERGWNEDAFILAHDLKGKTLCQSCGKTLIEHDRENCDRCRRDERMGAALVNAKYVAFSRGSGQFHIYGDYFVSISNKQKPEFTDCSLIYMLNSTEFEERKLYSLPVTIRFAANHVPAENGEIKSFSDIANQSKGSERLGILKADVDNLGFVFMEGFAQRYSVSRVATLSRMLDLFFSGYVNTLMEKEFKDVYSVFSGGDDLFLIGPWDQMPELAIRINRDFRAYAANNPCFTMSAAITLENAVSNVKTFAQTSERRLKQVKNRTDKSVYPEREGRNAVWFFNHFFSWEDFDKYIGDGKTLEQWIYDELVSTGQLRRIAGYSAMYRTFLRERSLNAARFDGLFAYDLRRNYDEKSGRHKVRSWAENLRDNSLNYRNLKKDFYFAEFCVNYALNKTKEKRRREDDGEQR